MQLPIKQKTWKNKAFFTELSQLHELFKLRFHCVSLLLPWFKYMKFKYSLFYCIVNSVSKRKRSCDVDFLEFNFLNEKFDPTAYLS